MAATWSVDSSPYRFGRPSESVQGASTAGKRPPAKNILKDPLQFPPFNELCVDNEIDERYYEESTPYSYARCCTWCFLGEITWDQLTLIPGMFNMRKRVVVTDRDGHAEIPIFFYPESGSFDYSTVKNGHTFCAMLAQQHHFLDMSTGLRIEDLDLVKVIPCSLDNLFAISTKLSQCADVTCWGCGETPADKPKKCASCGVACYCGKDCQTKDWKECHKKWCKAIPEFIKFTKINYQKPDFDALVSESGGRIW